MSEEVNMRVLPEGLAGPSAELGLRSLRRTQGLLGARTFYLAMAIFLTTLVLAFLPIAHEGLIALIRRTGSTGGVVTFAVACLFWGLFLKKCQELKATGLPPRRGIRARNAWGLGGVLVWFVALELTWTILGSQNHALIIGGIAGIAAIWIGERLHQIESADDIRFRSATQKIFDDQDNG